MLRIETLALGPFETNCYLASAGGPEALVIDPGSEPDRIVQALRANRWTPAAYVLTHGHIDHVAAVAEIVREMPAPVALHEADLPWAFDSQNQMPPFFAPVRNAPPVTRILRDGQVWNDAGLAYRILATPGHTPGSVCLYIESEAVLFSGDTLFAGSVGRTDLPGGSPRRLTESLRQLAALPPAVRVYPGHGPETTIGAEKKANFFMQFT